MNHSERLARHLGRTPDTVQALFIAANASVMGDVVLAARSSVFYGAVLRGDIHEIRIGEGTNIQDGTVVHLANDFPTVIGRHVTIGHLAIVHACVVEDECLIGMHATILDGAVIGAQSIIGAGALVTIGTKIPPGSLAVGAPARVVRPLTPEERAGLRATAEKYIQVAAAHKSKLPNPGR